MRSVPLILALALTTIVGQGQGIDDRRTPGDYSVSATVGSLELGAELKYRSVELGRDAVFLKEGIVIEVAIFGPKSKRIQVSPGQFAFRINGKEPPLMTTSPELLLYADKWGEYRTLNVQVNDANVQIGGPDAGPRFPGDPRGRGGQPTPPVEETKAPRATGAEPIEILRQTALPNGVLPPPIVGHLYLHYKKKIKSIKKLELLYRGPEGDAVLRLR